MTSEEWEIEVGDREAVATYFYWLQILLILVVGIWLFGLGIVAAIVHALWTGPWLTKKQADALRYWLDGATLRVDQGVYFLKRKAIPLDRITDVVLVQGPLMRRCGLWTLQVQTAGTGQGVAEAVMYGIDEPEKVRDAILAARDEAVSDDAGG